MSLIAFPPSSSHTPLQLQPATPPIPQEYSTIEGLLKGITPLVLEFFHSPELNSQLTFDALLFNFLNKKFSQISLAKTVDATYVQMEDFWKSIQSTLSQSTTPRHQLSERLWYVLNRLAHDKETLPCACALWITFFRSVESTLFLDALPDHERQLIKYFWRSDWKTVKQEVIKLPPNFDRIQYYFYAVCRPQFDPRRTDLNPLHFNTALLERLPDNWKHFILTCKLIKKQTHSFSIDCDEFPFIKFLFFLIGDVFNCRKRTLFHLIDMMQLIRNYINNSSQKLGTYLDSALQSIKNTGYIDPCLAWNNRTLVTKPPTSEQHPISAPLRPVPPLSTVAPTPSVPILPIIPKGRFLITDSQIEPTFDFRYGLHDLKEAYKNQSIPESPLREMATVRDCMLAIPAYIEHFLTLPQYHYSHLLNQLCHQRYLDACIELKRGVPRTVGSYELEIFFSVKDNLWNEKNSQSKIATFQAMLPGLTAELCEALVAFTCIPEHFGCHSTIEDIQSIAIQLPNFYSMAYFSQPLNPFLIFPSSLFLPIAAPLILQAWKEAANKKGWYRIEAYYDSLLEQLKNIST